MMDYIELLPLLLFKIIKDDAVCSSHSGIKVLNVQI